MLALLVVVVLLALSRPKVPRDAADAVHCGGLRGPNSIG